MQLPDTNSEDSNLPTEKPDTDKPEKIIIIQEKSKQPLIANIITGIAVIFSGLMFYYTYQLFNETRHATAISKQSADAATDAVAEQKKMDSFSIESQQKSSYQDSLNQDQNFKISKNALEVQLNSLKQAHNDFETENRPFLKFEPYNIQIRLQTKGDTIRPNLSPKSSKPGTISAFIIRLGVADTIVLNSSFSNLGRFPAYNIKISVTMGSGLDTNRILKKTKLVSVKMIDYVSGNSKTDTIGLEYIPNEPLDSLYKRKNLFFFIKIQYECPTLNKSSYHEYFVYRLKFDADHYGYFSPIFVKPN